MNDHFADAVGDVIQGVLEFQETLRAGKVPTVDEARPRFIRLIDAFAKKGAEQPERKLDYDLARSALVYWIDEMLTLHWGWPHAEDFRAVCLELVLHGFKEFEGTGASAARSGGRGALSVFRDGGAGQDPR